MPETPTPTNRAVTGKQVPLVKVRVVKQPIRHEGKTYLGPKDKGQPFSGQVFEASAEDVARYGELVAPVES